MYQDKMVVCLKNNGKILREKEVGIVSLPFNSEYSIYIKNLEGRKAKVKIQIDGEDVLNGQSLLVNPNDTTELEGFLNNCVARNKFKFIRKSQEISDFRGDRIDDSLIRIEFSYEKQKPITQEINYKYNWYQQNYPYQQTPVEPYKPVWVYNPGYITYTIGISDNVTINNISSESNQNISDTSYTYLNNQSSSIFTAQNCSLNSFNVDTGITVKGKSINQQFQLGNIGELEEISHVIVLKLLGYNDVGQEVKEVIGTRDKLQCSSCGKISKSDARFCDMCGTYLE